MASHPAIVILSEVSLDSCLQSLEVRNVNPLYSMDSPVNSRPFTRMLGSSRVGVYSAISVAST